MATGRTLVVLILGSTKGTIPCGATEDPEVEEIYSPVSVSTLQITQRESYVPEGDDVAMVAETRHPPLRAVASQSRHQVVQVAGVLLQPALVVTLQHRLLAYLQRSQE